MKKISVLFLFATCIILSSCGVNKSTDMTDTIIKDMMSTTVPSFPSTINDNYTYIELSDGIVQYSVLQQISDEEILYGYDRINDFTLTYHSSDYSMHWTIANLPNTIPEFNNILSIIDSSYNNFAMLAEKYDYSDSSSQYIIIEFSKQDGSIVQTITSDNNVFNHRDALYISQYVDVPYDYYPNNIHFVYNESTDEFLMSGTIFYNNEPTVKLYSNFKEITLPNDISSSILVDITSHSNGFCFLLFSMENGSNSFNILNLDFRYDMRHLISLDKYSSSCSLFDLFTLNSQDIIIQGNNLLYGTTLISLCPVTGDFTDIVINSDSKVLPPNNNGFSPGFLIISDKYSFILDASLKKKQYFFPISVNLDDDISELAFSYYYDGFFTLRYNTYYTNKLYYYIFTTTGDLLFATS